MFFAPQMADSYVVVLNSSSELQLHGEQGSVIDPDNSTTSLKNVAGCPNARIRQSYSGLSGAYLAKLVNPNVSSLKMVIMNTNSIPIANFSTSANSVTMGDTITFTDQSENGSYPIVTYNWVFGDNNTNSDSSVVQYAYPDSGQYSPSLTVSDGYLFHTIIKTGHINVSGGGGE
jgi:PKD repeat protein